MERLLEEIRENGDKTDIMDHQELAFAMGEIQYASSEDRIKQTYEFEY